MDEITILSRGCEVRRVEYAQNPHLRNVHYLESNYFFLCK
jgi:hypothetical protein